MRALPLALLLLLALLPSAAGAATVRIDTRCENPTGKGPESCGGVLTFVAAPGEVNDVTADAPTDGSFVLRDTGAPLTAGTGCTQIDAASARCPRASGNASLGDGDDRLAFPPSLVFLTVAGDVGNDLITAPGIVHGGDGDDAISGPQLDGGPGDDLLTGTAGEDHLFGDLGDDRIDRGPGSDTVEYGRAPSFGAVAPRPGPQQPVTVDLADPAPDGAAGERDTLVGIENVTAPDAKGDVLRGGAGDDQLAGLGGADVLDGGAGDDLLDASEQAPERTLDVDELRCGLGRDRVARPDIYDRASSCERIAVGGGLVVSSATLRKRSGPRVEVTVLCARATRCVADVASAAASGRAFNPNRRISLAPGARRHLVLDRFHPGAKARLRRSKVIAFGTKDHGFAVRVGA